MKCAVERFEHEIPTIRKYVPQINELRNLCDQTWTLEQGDVPLKEICHTVCRVWDSVRHTLEQMEAREPSLHISHHLWALDMYPSITEEILVAGIPYLPEKDKVLKRLEKGSELLTQANQLTSLLSSDLIVKYSTDFIETHSGLQLSTLNKCIGLHRQAFDLYTQFEHLTYRKSLEYTWIVWDNVKSLFCDSLENRRLTHEAALLKYQTVVLSDELVVLEKIHQQSQKSIESLAQVEQLLQSLVPQQDRIPSSDQITKFYTGLVEGLSHYLRLPPEQITEISAIERQIIDLQVQFSVLIEEDTQLDLRLEQIEKERTEIAVATKKVVHDRGDLIGQAKDVQQSVQTNPDQQRYYNERTNIAVH